MKKILSILLLVVLSVRLLADNFVISHGQGIKLYVMRTADDTPIHRADRLFAADYAEVFGALATHTQNMPDARIIAATYDNAELRKFAKLRGVNFDRLAGLKNAFILKVHNNGSQLFVVGSDELGVAHGLMTLCRYWGVSPFKGILGIPALQQDRFELGVVYENLVTPTVEERVLVLNQEGSLDPQWQDLLMRLRGTRLVTDARYALSPQSDGFTWTVSPASVPYHGLALVLDHPQRLRIEGQRALKHHKLKTWQLILQNVHCGELQTSLFFDMAWDLKAFGNAYAVERFIDQHYAQTSGIATTWSQLWNDYFDLPLHFRPEQPLSVESLRRGIGESQALALQLSLELNNKVVKPNYSKAFFNTVEYPLNILTTQIQRLCNQQLLSHNMVTQWTVDDCAQRMQLLIKQLNETTGTVSAQLQEAVPFNAGQLDEQDSDVMLYRSTSGIGTQIEPYQALHLPLNYQAASLRLRCSFLPVRNYGKPSYCIVSVDNGKPQLIAIREDDSASRQLNELVFEIDPKVEKHQISFRTSTDGVWLQRVWLLDFVE